MARHGSTFQNFSIPIASFDNTVNKQIREERKRLKEKIYASMKQFGGENSILWTSRKRSWLYSMLSMMCYLQDHSEIDFIKSFDELNNDWTFEFSIDDPGVREAFSKGHPLDFSLCYGCGKKATFTCSKCFLIQYCSKECSINKWPYHKRICKHMIELILYKGDRRE